MRRLLVRMMLPCAAVVACAAPAAVTGAAEAGVAPTISVTHVSTWRTAVEVPGLGRLNKGGTAAVSSVSCSSAGNCAAGGNYLDGFGHQQGFVVGERNGRWRAAVEVPGLGRLNKGGNAAVTSVSCASAGNCAAAGHYQDGSDNFQGFVVSERNGRWRTPVEVPGLGRLNRSGNAVVTSVSCASAGNCAAGGYYRDGSRRYQGFVVSERNGRWRMAIEVPGLGRLNNFGDARVSSVSCPSAGNCAAGGYYQYGSGHYLGFVVSERNGRWRTAIEVPGLSRLSKGDAAVTSVSCTSAGNCAAGGYHTAHQQGFVVSERNGRWGPVVKVPGLGRLNKTAYAAVYSVSCASAGNCAAGGHYQDGSQRIQGFVVSERNGRWRVAIKVPGLGRLSKGGAVVTVSCTPAGNCTAGGYYVDGFGHQQGFVVSRT